MSLDSGTMMVSASTMPRIALLAQNAYGGAMRPTQFSDLPYEMQHAIWLETVKNTETLQFDTTYKEEMPDSSSSSYMRQKHRLEVGYVFNSTCFAGMHVSQSSRHHIQEVLRMEKWVPDNTCLKTKTIYLRGFLQMYDECLRLRKDENTFHIYGFPPLGFTTVAVPVAGFSRGSKSDDFASDFLVKCLGSKLQQINFVVNKDHEAGHLIRAIDGMLKPALDADIRMRLQTAYAVASQQKKWICQRVPGIESYVLMWQIRVEDAVAIKVKVGSEAENLSALAEDSKKVYEELIESGYKYLGRFKTGGPP